jgi:ribose 5-phosphate isomerase B
MRLAVSSDERVPLTDHVVAWLEQHGHDVTLCGALSDGMPDPWPHAAEELAVFVASGQCEQGILFCYTGTGVTMVANKIPGIRAALCADAQIAHGARKWNHANVLAMSYRLTTDTVADEILDAWFSAPLGTGEDQEAVEQIAEIERRYRSG